MRTSLTYSPKRFTEEATQEARLKCAKDSEYARVSGVKSGASRRYKALVAAINGTKSRKTARTACTTLLSTIFLLNDFKHVAYLKKKIVNLAKTMPLLHAFAIVSHKIQDVAINEGRGFIEDDGWKLLTCPLTGRSSKVRGKDVTTNPFRDFVSICVKVEDFVKELINELAIVEKSAVNTLINPHLGNNDDQSSDASKSNSLFHGSVTPKRQNLPTEVFREFAKAVGKSLQSFEFRQAVAKARDCFYRCDFQRFEYLKSEATKGRSIFAKTGKFATKKKARTHFVDKVAGQRGFLERYGVAADKSVGFVYA